MKNNNINLMNLSLSQEENNDIKNKTTQTSQLSQSSQSLTTQNTQNAAKSGLESQVLQYALQYPEKYKKAQIIGESVVNSNYELQEGDDNEGEKIIAKRLLQVIYDYNLNVQDLSLDEINLLQKVYGIEWRNKIE